ncbi:MAG: hypothetical protein KDA80_06390 [Planctomycetaceae bacterium]|nr:hypothetical protein [Planctomycetaceae bacterium]
MSAEKQRELEQLRQQVRELELELQKEGEVESAWPPKDFYGMYYFTTGAFLGMIAATVSLIVNVILAPIAGKSPLELVKVYLTFPLGARALDLSADAGGGLILTLGCCLYLCTGLALGIPLYFLLVRFAGGKDASLIKRLVISSVLSLAIWFIAFYGVLIWLQPMLFGGNWITDPAVLPTWVAAGTHLIFGWTMALLYPWGQFTPYRSMAYRAAT